jgi:hypothetical protein
VRVGRGDIGREGIGGARVAAAEGDGGKGQRSGGVWVVGCCGLGCEDQTLDEAGAAVGDEAEFGGVVLVLGAQDAGGAEQIAVEAERGEEIAGVVDEAGGVGEAGG